MVLYAQTERRGSRAKTHRTMAAKTNQSDCPSPRSSGSTLPADARSAMVLKMAWGTFVDKAAPTAPRMHDSSSVQG